MLSLLPVPRAAALTDGPVTIDLDTTDVEVYAAKEGVAYYHQGQRVGRPHVASWAEAETVLAADLGDGTDDPRATAPGLLRRALAALPPRARASGRVALRADAGYFAGQLARAAHEARIGFVRIGAKRIAPLWRLLVGLADGDWHDAIDMDNAQIAVAGYCPDWWPANTALLIRRVALDPEQVSADPRSRRRRTLHPDQRALPFPELTRAGAIYAYSFILTNLDVSSPDKAVATEHWYRHRTTVENIFRDSKLGAALRHLPYIGIPQVNLAWMWGALLAATMAAWLHQLTAVTAGEDILAGHGVRGGKAMIATLRRRLIAVPGRADPPRPPPGPAASAWPLSASRGAGPAAGTARPRLTTPTPEPQLPVLVHGLPAPTRRKAPHIANPASAPGPSACPLPGIPAHQDHSRRQGSAHRAIRGIGSDESTRPVDIHFQPRHRWAVRAAHPSPAPAGGVS